MKTAMTSERIKEIQATTGYPDSVSIKQALLQVWNECEQSYASQPSPVMSAEQFELKPCDKCLQLTNHIGNICQKCVAKMSAEQVDGCCSLELCSSKKRLSVQCIKPNDCQFPAASPSVKADGWEKFDVRKVIPFELKNGRYVDSNGNEITTSMLMKNRHDIYFDNGLLYID